MSIQKQETVGIVKKTILLAVLVLFVITCDTANKPQLKLGKYNATLVVKDNKQLPFTFEVTSSNTLKIFNAEEVIHVDEVTYKNDSVYIKMPVYEGYIAAKFDKQGITGVFVKESLNRTVIFNAKYNNDVRFETKNKAQVNVTGNWETMFSKGIKNDEYIAKGIFKQKGQNVTGTFRTQTGDYRYLEGVVDGNELKLSTFDGAHAFLFTATLTDSTMNGFFYSGNHFKEPFTATLNNDYDLPDSDNLTYIKAEYDGFNFSFPESPNTIVSLNDTIFENKVVVVQIMGTWCPNCLDESKYYKTFYENNKDKNLQFVGLAFEYAKTEETAFKSIKRLKQRIGINYPILLAQYGTENKTLAQKKLPMLNRVLSYPTTIIIDKKHNVRKIHTGFDGPATGDKYISFKKEFETFISKLLNE